MKIRDSSNRINSKRTINVSETNLNCLSDFRNFLYFDDKSRDKQEINRRERFLNLFSALFSYLSAMGSKTCSE